MRIDVTYAGEAPRVIETGGESMLSAATVAGSPEWSGTGLPVTAAMLRPRTDLLGREGNGLVVELCAWSAATDGWRGDAAVQDFGHRTEAPRLELHVFRVWEVLPPEDVARAVAIDVDGRVHVRRVGGRLLDLTAYERLEDQVLSRSERDAHALGQRVALVHARLAAGDPALTDEAIGDMYGLGTALWEWAVSSGDGEGRSAATRASRDDGLGELADSLAAEEDPEVRVDVLMGAMLDDPSLTLDRLGAELASRGVGADEAADAWAEAEGRIADEAGWDDGAWDGR